jgi:four helix bundle protein
MATARSFEDLDIWKKAQALGASVYEFCDKNPKIAKDFSFKDQIKRAALSVSNNIAEGFEYNNNNDFYRFLRIAKGSCGEVRNCLLFSIRIGYTIQEDIITTLESSKILGSQIGSLLKYLKQKKTEQLKANKPITLNSQPTTHNN